ncbi:MAG: dihydroneopterin aldolase [Lentisphaerae bacterium]|jgi:dihydroneopterin aldolase|nr:dihydroneopterin aldolase [Lentisphaerota bacterium]
MAEQPHDLIRIRGWELKCLVGVYEEERHAPRTLHIDLTIHLPAADRQDDLSRTVDYARLQQAIAQALSATSYRLIESVAERIAAVVLEDKRVTAVTVCVGKPGVLPGVRTVEAEITRLQEKSD